VSRGNGEAVGVIIIIIQRPRGVLPRSRSVGRREEAAALEEKKNNVGKRGPPGEDGRRGRAGM